MLVLSLVGLHLLHALLAVSLDFAHAIFVRPVVHVLAGMQLSKELLRARCLLAAPSMASVAAAAVVVSFGGAGFVGIGAGDPSVETGSGTATATGTCIIPGPGVSGGGGGRTGRPKQALVHHKNPILKRNPNLHIGTNTGVPAHTSIGAGR